MNVTTATARLGDQVTLGDGEVVEIVGIVPDAPGHPNPVVWVYLGRDDQAWASRYYTADETFEVVR